MQRLTIIFFLGVFFAQSSCTLFNNLNELQKLVDLKNPQHEKAHGNNGTVTFLQFLFIQSTWYCNCHCKTVSIIRNVNLGFSYQSCWISSGDSYCYNGRWIHIADASNSLFNKPSNTTTIGK